MISIANRSFQAAFLGELGDTKGAIRIYRELEQEKLTGLWRAVIRYQRAMYEDKREAGVKAAEWIMAHSAEPEALGWAARPLAFFEERDRAIAALNRSFDCGFNVYRFFTRENRWLDSLRGTPGFEDLLRRSESRYLEAVAAFQQVDGERLLGAAVLG